MSGFSKEIVISVRTGDVQYAGTDANVAIVLHDKHGSSTEKINLNHFFRNDFERGNLDVFELPTDKTGHLSKLHKLEVFRDNSGLGSAWFVERITVENRSSGDVHIFPVFRWLRPHFHYVFREHDTCLPQDDDQLEQRKLDLEEKKKSCVINQSDPTLPAQVLELPIEEQFSPQYRGDIRKLKYNLIAQSFLTIVTTGTWRNLEDIKNVYTREIFYEPEVYRTWQEDWRFGYQRLNGPCPNIIRLCTEIPAKLGAKEHELEPFLEGKSVNAALSEKALFICDLEILHQFPVTVEDSVICAPIVLLYRNKKKQLLPIAIQLFQEPAPQNPEKHTAIPALERFGKVVLSKPVHDWCVSPVFQAAPEFVFFPSDDKYTWILAKMWYNNAEANYHQALTHLGNTHFAMEGVCLALHRNVSLSHPIFKLLAPHLLYLMAINAFGLKKLINKGGWMDRTMTLGCEGAFELIRRGRKDWKLNIHGNLLADLKDRGVCDPDVLPRYYYRDDGLLLYHAIQKYVDSYVNLYYESESCLANDTEIQAWAREMVKSREDGGIGIQGVPGDGEFQDVSQLIETLTDIIFTCSVQHAAVNFPMYDYYGFPPALALILRGKPPCDKKPRTEAEIISNLPNKKKTFDAMIVAKILSRKASKSLGDFEVQYVFDPKAKEVVEQFRDHLKYIGKSIIQRNSERSLCYDYLHPDSIPNSISI